MSVPDPEPSPNTESPLFGGLTPRQREVFDWMRQGKTNWEIGKILGCTEATVKKHLQRIYYKLGVANRMSAANALRE